MNLCKCGCGQEVGNIYISGHNTRINNPMNNLQSRKKVGLSNKGKLSGRKLPPRSEETKRKISKANKGKKRPDMVGNKNPAKRPEVRKKISKNYKGMTGKQPWNKGKKCPQLSGKNNPMFGKRGPETPGWKGGIACEPYCQVWSDEEYKQSIRDRDENKCLNPDCWGTSNKLHLHHINYVKKDCSPKNIITICTSCNSRANKNRDWHQSWYEAIIYRRY